MKDVRIIVKKVHVYQFNSYFDKYKYKYHWKNIEWTPIVKIIFEFKFKTSLWKRRFQKVCDKKIKKWEIHRFWKVFEKFMEYISIFK